MAKYVLTNKAVEDLSAIWNYTVQAWSESQADKYYKAITSSFNAIVRNPGIGKKYTQIARALLGFRVGSHIVFYRQARSGNIEIMRVLHASMDLKSRLEE